MTSIDSVHELLNIIGPGRMPSIAYDTAWAARLGEIAPDISSAALEWICANQLPDGAWGAAEPFYYHDRVISTLAAMIALSERGRRAGDKIMIENGLAALNRIVGSATQGLAADPNGETIGFEMIVPTLVADAHRLGLIPNQDNRILGRMGDIRKIKQTKLMHRINRHITPAFSAEMAGMDTEMLDIPELPEQNGSIAYSPAASAYYALIVKPGDERSLVYLRKSVNSDGGMPNVAPFDIFEVAWVLWNLALTNPQIVHDPQVARHVEFLRNSWHSGKGAGFAAGYSVFDGDDSALVFDTLWQYDGTEDINEILSFEAEDHFRCYALEANPSTCTHAHILGALRRAGMPPEAEPVRKALGFLQRTRMPSGYWFDKWHLSPYYVTCHLIIVCSDFAPWLTFEAVEWVLATQLENGSWGTYNSTAEESAYCIQALWVWQQAQAPHKNPLIGAAIKRGLAWLQDHAQPPYLPLWIGKGLYCPENVIQSAILSALAIAEG